MGGRATPYFPVPPMRYFDEAILSPENLAAMTKNLFLPALFVLMLGLGSCQCSDKPPMPPTESENTAVLVEAVEKRA